MRKLQMTLALALGIGIATAFTTAPEVSAHGAACGSTCVDADGDNEFDDLATCMQPTEQSSPSGEVCGCILAGGEIPGTGQHASVAAISGYSDPNGPNGCVEVNAEETAVALSSNGETDVEQCRETAGQACWQNGCATVEYDSDAC